MYFPGTSWLHRLHPSVKVVAWVLLTIVIASLPWRLNLLVALALVAALVSMGVPFSHYRLTILITVPVAIVSPILNVAFPDPTMHQILFWAPVPSLQVAGGLAIHFSPRPVFYEALRQGIDRDFLYTNALIVSIIVLCTTSLQDLADAPTYLGLPHVVGFVIATTLRYIPVVANSILTLYDVQEARGVDFYTRNPAINFQRRGNVLVPVLVFQLSRASRMSNAMESRGFQIGASPTLYALRAMSRGEKLFLGAVVAVTALVIVLRVYTGIVPGNYPFEFGTF
jgi:energy-coupling factor transport system permease protein